MKDRSYRIGDIVTTRCACGIVHDQPLKRTDCGTFDGAQIAAYYYCVLWFQPPVLGNIHLVEVRSPFCCRVGNFFWSYDGGLLILAQVKSVVKTDKWNASLYVRVRDIIRPDKFLEPANPELLHGYDYSWIAGFGKLHAVEAIDPNEIQVIYTEGGDYNYFSNIRTDDQGIDHCYMCRFSDLEGSYVFVGDRVLGFAKDRPPQWSEK